MTALDWALVLVWVAAVPQTIFVLLYGLTNHWWLSWIGRALFTKAFGLALLLDMSLLGYYYKGLLDQTESNFVIGLVALGACMQLFALLLDKRPSSRNRFDEGGDA
jgi:hypothetical protein